MPLYNVWYQNKTEPLEFSSASRVREEQILDRIFEHEKLAPDASSTLSERIEKNNLAPVRYTEDESEPYTIG
jgi:hypothetical protein